MSQQSPETKYAGRHVLVTGAGSGIGAAIARGFTLVGANVTLAGRRSEPLETLASELNQASGRSATFVAAQFDVTDESSINEGMNKARAAFGPVSILINNAGEAPSSPFEKTSLDMWSNVLSTNLTGTFQVTQAALPDLKGHGKDARIINIASTAGLTGYAYVSAYCAAKHGVIGITRALALELAKTGITVNAVCPGYTDTPIVRQAIETIMAKTGRSEEEALAHFVASNPQKRLVQPHEVADTVLWLASTGASSINGQAIAVAGGEVLVG
jgi:NAD(P)-dependent dehydrogenase (short-subunit alcohol dehydrogenase family)